MPPKLLGWIAVAAVVAAVGYVGIGSWIAATSLDGMLRVGAPTAQGDGWPAPQRPEDIGYVGDPRVAFGYDFTDVEIETDIGAMPAWLVKSASSDATRWAIVVHGIGGRRENGYRLLPALRDSGLASLLISYRNDAGAPKSPDGYYAFGLTEWADLQASVQYALDHGARDVVLVGESMGGGIIGQFMLQSQLADKVAGIVLDAPAVDFTAIVADQIARMGLPLGQMLASGGVWVSGMMTPIRIGTADVVEVLANYDGPIFLSHGASDRIVPVGTSDTLVGQRAAVTQYLRTKADHIQSWQEDPARYDAALGAFVKTAP